MEIPLLLIFLLGLALKLGEIYSTRLVVALPPAPLPEPHSVPEEGWVALPQPRREGWSESASSAEMTFAGQVLHLVGLLMLTCGALSYLRLSGISQAATSGGWAQTGGGVGLGLFLCWSGERAFGRGLRNYAHPLLAGGCSLLLLTLGAAHFHFHLLPMLGFALSTFAVVAWVGAAVLRHDAPLIAGCMVLALFYGPLLMTFPMDRLASVLGYLLAINLATTAVAYRMRWDAFLVASFAGTYGLYFHSFGMAHPLTTLAFLLATYTLFLVSGTLFHLLRRSASQVDLTMSLVNPLLFAYASYTTLLQLPPFAALTAYFAVAILHTLLSVRAFGLREEGPGYGKISWIHTALAIFFSTAGISFCTYCSNDASYFGLVTLLWLVQGVALLWASDRLELRFQILTRRASYLNMMLAAYQLLAVVPWMEQPFWVEVPGSLTFLAYFWYHASRVERCPDGYLHAEQRAFSNLALLAALACLHDALVGDMALILTGTALAPLLLLAYRRFPITLSYYRYAASGLATLMAVVSVCYPWSYGTPLLLLVLAALSGSLALIYRGDDRESLESPLGALLAALLLLRYCVVLAHLSLTTGFALAAMVALALLGRGMAWPRLFPAALLGTLGLGLLGLLLPVQPAALAAVFGVSWLLLRNKGKSTESLATLAVLFMMKTALQLHTGPLSTLLWCLLALLRLNTTGRLLLFAAFLKSVCFDASLLVGPEGLNLTAYLGLGAGVLLCYAWSARATREVEWRNLFLLEGVVVFAFQVSYLLYALGGILDNFQVLLSGFWACSSLIFVAAGIHARIKLFRLFGLVVLVSCVAKMYLVDIALLDSYDRTTITFGLGGLLMLVSFFYQFNRARLQPVAA